MHRRALFLILALLFLAGCGRSNPFDRILKSVANQPEYMIILDDMREEGAFIKSYRHRYKLVVGERVQQTRLLRVPKEFYRQHVNHLGMTIASKTKGGQPSAVAGPPGYAYVGNAQYGQWRNDRRGNSFWEFYGKYRLMTDVIGMGSGLIYRNNYNSYRNFNSQGRPYFGASKQYGTNGRVTQKSRPNFYGRRQARQTAQRQRFGQRFNKRFGRTRSRARFGGGFGGFGK